MGTIISSIALYCISYPKYVYKKLFNRSYLDYTKETIGYLSLFLGLAFLTFKLSRLIIISNAFLSLVINCVIAVIIPNIILLILFWKTNNFKYYLELLKEFKNRGK